MFFIIFILRYLNFIYSIIVAVYRFEFLSLFLIVKINRKIDLLQSSFSLLLLPFSSSLFRTCYYNWLQMQSGECCVVAPHFSPSKLSTFEDDDMQEINVLTKETKKTPSIIVSKGYSTTKGSRVHNSCGVADNFIIMTALRSKILTLRDLLDLSPCLGSASVNELLILTLKDLHKLYPSINPNVPLSNIDGAGMDQALECFCDTLKSIGEMWTGDDKFMAEFNEDSHSKLHDDLKRYGLVLLDEMIKLATERVFDMMDVDDQTRDESPSSDTFGRPLSESYSSNESSPSSPPPTPTSVLSEIVINGSQKSELKVQAIEKLNPIDVKRLYFHLLPHAIEQDQGCVVQLATNFSEQISEIQAGDDCEFGQDCDMTDSPNILLTVMDNVSENRGTCCTGASNNQPVSSPVSLDVRLPPSTLPKLRSYVAEQAAAPLSPFALSPNVIESPPMTSRNKVTPPPPSPPPPPPRPMAVPPPPPKTIGNVTTVPPPPPMTSGNVISPPPPPPLPIRSKGITPLLPPKTTGSVISPPPPPPPPIGSKGMTPPPPPPPKTSNGAVPAPPPPMPMGKGPAPPPPLGFMGVLRVKRAATKLKRSSQMGNLYRLLKSQVEGSSLDSKSQKRTGKVCASAGGKQGMADALAEMTKRSAYFHQIEEDVVNHAKTIKEIKTAIASFQTSNMSELVKFHKYIESHLEKLTDECQVLARFEDFPTKKLEELRMAAALYSKLDSIDTTLKNWPIVSPVGELLDKAESYFNKIKGEIETLDRTKDEESKKFTSHNIHFDFGIIVRIKELMVDVSSNCMELVLKERREAKTKNDGHKKLGSSKLLWKAFQFAFRVYTFAGGQDDRADKLTRELAQEIQTNPNQ
ncbi:uncharacterized protein LOC107812484 [Nicotiana tabacum]|uniref:Uncharacterized protein LOC107812484 n=1 Tax=Nicotiana tabacum TaxID=4097 RepID=A0A1S4BW88_TOBAC